ncbi:hypothetical protein [Rhodobacter sp. SY28-1]|uniref:hypothetical protein n=1 Tax=Rhodobacter sp. SY28-1 TaxID=2562317 RepID=UPI0010C06250|nr:hypothetical protein [Rhodobacter sp. SY28-1]
MVAATERAETGSTVVLGGSGTVPKSASLTGPSARGLGELVSITPVAASSPASGADHCSPRMELSAAPGAMILMSLSAPCNRNERIIVRHSGLSFTARTENSGGARVLIPAMKADAMVAVYLSDAHLVLGNVAVPDMASYTRYAVAWEWPAELELRATDGEKVLVGTVPTFADEPQRILSLGAADVQSPIRANVYSTRGSDLGTVDLTGEVRITPASCGRTLRLDTVFSAHGEVTVQEQDVAVPLCGTAGDILLLKNLGAAPKLATPK